MILRDLCDIQKKMDLRDLQDFTWRVLMKKAWEGSHQCYMNLWIGTPTHHHLRWVGEVVLDCPTHPHRVCGLSSQPCPSHTHRGQPPPQQLSSGDGGPDCHRRPRASPGRTAAHARAATRRITAACMAMAHVASGEGRVWGAEHAPPHRGGRQTVGNASAG